MKENLMEWIGLVPAIVFPASSLIQLSSMVKSREAAGVSASTWGLVGIANICLFIYTQKYTDIFSIAALLGAAVLNFSVAGTALYFQRRTTQSN